MAEGFTKLFGSILASTVWQEPDSTRLTWITMMAMADRDGVVSASVPGLAHMARVSLPQVESALATFLAPDPYSRTPDHDGRRIEAVHGGWRLLNHAMYRQRIDEEARRERKREWDRKHRPSGHSRTQSDHSPTQSDESAQNRHIAEADTEAEAVRAKATVHPVDAQRDGEVVPKRINGSRPPQTALRFPEFWAAFPVKKGRAEALKKWKARGLDGLADTIIAHVRRMEAEDDQWKRGFIPHGSTYVNGELWNDEPVKDKPMAPNGRPEPSGRMPDVSEVVKRVESKLENAIGFIRQRYQRGEFGSGEGAREAMQREIEAATQRYRGAE